MELEAAFFWISEALLWGAFFGFMSGFFLKRSENKNKN